MTAAAWGPGTGQAGGRAEARFDELLRAWRRRMRLRLLAFGLLYSAVIVVPLHLLAVFVSPHWVWAAGASAGALLSFLMVIRDSPPEYIERLRTGAEGEKRTQKALKGLDPPWLVQHDLDGGVLGGNVDHIVVGPAGVFVLDSKWFAGETAIEDGIVRVRRFEDPDLTYVAARVPQQMRRRASLLHDELRRMTHLNVWVTPVVVLWGHFDAGLVDADGVVYIAGHRLRGWLLGRDHTLHPLAIERVSGTVAGKAAISARGPRMPS